MNQELPSHLGEKLTNWLGFDCKKSVFIWSSSFENLQLFCKKSLNIESYSTTSGDRFQSLKAKNITFNLYKTGTLQLQGNLSRSIKSTLHSILTAQQSADSVSFQLHQEIGRHLESSDDESNDDESCSQSDDEVIKSFSYAEKMMRVMLETRNMVQDALNKIVNLTEDIKNGLSKN